MRLAAETVLPFSSVGKGMVVAVGECGTERDNRFDKAMETADAERGGGSDFVCLSPVPSKVEDWLREKLETDDCVVDDETAELEPDSVRPLEDALALELGPLDPPGEAAVVTCKTEFR